MVVWSPAQVPGTTGDTSRHRQDEPVTNGSMTRGCTGRISLPDAGRARLLLHDPVRQVEQGSRAAELCAYATNGDQVRPLAAVFARGGMAIAAREPIGGDLDTSQYAEAARRGYLHLREHNLAYLDDGVENIIGDYCALLAAVELTRTLGAEVARRGAGSGRPAVPASAPIPISATIGPPTTMALALLPRRRGRPAGAGAAGYRHRAGSGAPVGGPDRRRAGPGRRAGSRPGRQSFALARQYVKGVDETPW